MRRNLRAAMFGAAWAIAAGVSPATTSAATTLGETFDPGTCSPQTYIQTASPPGGPSYTAPFDGVITRWSYQSDANPPPTVRLKVARDFGGGTLQIVAESAVEPIVPSSVNTYQSRVSMPAGTDLGEYIDDDCSRADAAYTDYYADGDLSVGTTSSLFSQEHYQQNISAVLEPDADRDVFGDESQDRCVGTAGPFNGCPSEVTLGKPKAKKGKKIIVTATVPGAGTLSAGVPSDPALATVAKGRPLRPVTETLTATTRQKVRLVLKLTKVAKKNLRRKGKLGLKVRTVYTPSGGPPSSATRKVKVNKCTKGRKPQRIKGKGKVRIRCVKKKRKQKG